MTGENKDLENKIKYSIWDTRIDKSQLEMMEKSPELREELNHKKYVKEE